MASTRRTGIIRWLATGAFMAGALVLGCTYSPDFRNGSLKCSADGQCPSGYTCLNQFCCLPGDITCGGTMQRPLDDASVPTDSSSHFDVGLFGTGGHPATGTGGTTVSTSNVSVYLGTWSFSATTTLDTECEGAGSSGGPAAFLNQNNPTSTITISNNGDGTLRAVWSEWPDCFYTLAVDDTGAHGTDSDSWACEYDYTPAASSQPQISKQLWFYETFDIAAPAGATATHDGVYVRQDTYTDDSYVLCTQTLHAPMTKQ